MLGTDQIVLGHGKEISRHDLAKIYLEFVQKRFNLKTALNNLIFFIKKLEHGQLGQISTIHGTIGFTLNKRVTFVLENIQNRRLK
jgi:hypothetical protein